MKIRRNISFRVIKQLTKPVAIIYDEEKRQYLIIQGVWALAFDDIFCKRKSKETVLGSIRKKYPDIPLSIINRDFEVFLREMQTLKIVEEE